MSRTVRPLEPSMLRRLSRSAVVLARTPKVTATGRQLAEKVCGALQAELRTSLRCQASICETTSRPLRLPEGRCYLVFQLGADGRTALLELETGFAAALVDRLSGGAGAAFPPELPSTAEVAALSYLALHAVRAAREADGVEADLSPRFAQVARDAAEAGALISRERAWVTVSLDLAVGEARSCGRLLLPTPSADRLARLCSGEPVRGPLPEQVSRAALTAHVFCGCAGLEEAELQGLCPGDAIILSGLSRTPAGLAGDATLQFESFHLHGALTGRAFTLASISDALRPEALMQDGPTLVSTLPIDVQVELARIKVPLSQLDQIKPGSVIDLEASLSDPVVLRVGDRAVAKAELVDIDGELGARILALLS